MSGSAIKLTAMILMLIDHSAIMFLKTGILPRGDLYQAMRDIGRLAFPLFGFLLSEGVLHTKNPKKYLLRMLIFALLSEIPFDLVVRASWFDLSKQNVYFTLIFGMISVLAIKWGTGLKGKKAYAGTLAAMLVTAAMFLLAEFVFKTDYTGPGVLMIAVMGLSAAPLEDIRLKFTEQQIRAFLFAAAVILLAVFKGPNEYYALLGVLLVVSYKGKRGFGGKVFQYIGYAFYPVHLLILGLLIKFL